MNPLLIAAIAGGILGAFLIGGLANKIGFLGEESKPTLVILGSILGAGLMVILSLIAPYLTSVGLQFIPVV